MLNFEKFNKNADILNNTKFQNTLKWKHIYNIRNTKFSKETYLWGLSTSFFESKLTHSDTYTQTHTDKWCNWGCCWGCFGRYSFVIVLSHLTILHLQLPNDQDKLFENLKLVQKECNRYHPHDITWIPLKNSILKYLYRSIKLQNH